MGWVGLPKTIHCNETKRTHSMRYILLCAIISWPAVGGLAYWPVPAVGPKERIGLKVRTSWREPRSYRQRRIKRMARPLPAGKSRSRIYCWRWRSLPSRSCSRVSSAPSGEISATRRSLRITIDTGDAGCISPVMGLAFEPRFQRSSRASWSATETPSLVSHGHGSRSLREPPFGDAYPGSLIYCSGLHTSEGT